MRNLGLDGASTFVFDEQMSQLQQVGETDQTAKSFTQAEPLPISSGGSFARYQAAWSDKTVWVAYYNKERFRLVNTETGAYRDVDFGSSPEGKLWASCARWSPDGQKLALIMAAGENSPLDFTTLAIFNPSNNHLQMIEDDVVYVTDIAWAPDNQQVLMVSQVDSKEGRSLVQLFIANPLTQIITHVPVLPEDSAQIAFCNGLAWSQDGNSVALTYFAYPSSDIGWYRLKVENK